jgi:hypothetical protein
MKLEDVLSSCKLVLKQLNTEDLGEHGLAAMNHCFTGFTGPIDPESEYAREGREIFTKRFGNQIPMEADLSLARRYAGDRSLERGQYFAVCKNQSGNDGGTLCRELGAYHNPLKAGLITIIDPTVLEHAGHVPLQLRGQEIHDLLLLFPPVGGKPHPFAARFSADAQPLYLSLPLRLIETEIDLRDPAVADWFAASVTRLDWSTLVPKLEGHPTPAFPFKPHLDRFIDLLPALLCQSLVGGQGVVQTSGV